jgi:N-acetylneuraminate synthase
LSACSSNGGNQVLDAKTFSEKFPRVVLGLSDHTEGCISVLGAVALGARMIEKHFTDDTGREGPDHTFSLDPITWSEMVESVRTLELALGDGIKRVEENELETVIIQRRGLRFTQNLSKGTVLNREHLSALRPAPANSYKASELNLVVGKRINTDVFENQDVLTNFLE